MPIRWRRSPVDKSTSAVAHQFDDTDQQHEASTLGMWVFLGTEILFFGGMFLAYIVYRTMYSAAFAQASHYMDLALGGINTAVLLTSSLTMALAVHSAREGNKRKIVTSLLITMVLGATFLAIKAVEYTHKFQEHLVPGVDFHFPGPYADHAQIYFILYFMMTGFHALHLLIGIGILSVMMVFALKNRFSASYYSPIEVSGLYWHFVDIVWIFLYPLLYLIHVYK
jgi:cytochrome c oxidase subunit 3